jgi:hypothetical protein
MKKSSIFIALGTFALVIAGIVATKANKKFLHYTGPIYAYEGTGIGYVTLAFTGSCIQNIVITTTATHPLTFEGYGLFPAKTNSPVQLKYQ